MAKATTVTQGQEFVPVILGGDASAYSIARAFADAYGVVSVVVSTMAGGAVSHSRFIENSLVTKLEDADGLVAHLTGLGERFGATPLLLISTVDHLVELVVAQRDRLEPRFTIPYVDRDLLARLSDKSGFAALAAELDIAHPRTRFVDFTQSPVAAPADVDDLGYPMIVKPDLSADWQQVTFPGKAKVHTVASRAELDALLATVAEAGYTGLLVCQELIPGDDQGMRILTTYSDRCGRVRFACYGTVLVEEHAPATLGNPAGIISGSNPDIVAQAVRLLEHVGWVGYANFDLKHDPRTGRDVFFELNPRLGRSNLYVTAAGHNVAVPYVEEWVRGRDPFPGSGDRVVENTTEHVYSILPSAYLRRYVTDPATRRTLDRLILRRKVSHPLVNLRDPNPRRLAYAAAAMANQVRKFRRHYPVPKASR